MLQREPFEHLHCGTSEEGARNGLLGLITGLSEDLYCAGWMLDVEYELWEASRDEPTNATARRLTTRQRTLLRLLSDEADGWWRWVDETGAVFVPMVDWLRLVRDHHTR